MHGGTVLQMVAQKLETEKYQQSMKQTVKDTKGTSWYWRIAVSMVDHNVTITAEI